MVSRLLQLSPRLKVMVTSREYALERLEASAEVSAVRLAQSFHAAMYGDSLADKTRTSGWGASPPTMEA